MASSKQVEKENDNYNRYTRLLQDVTPKVLRKLFETRALSLKQVSSIDCFLADSNVSNTLQQHLVKIRVLRQHQLDLLYPPDGSAVKMEDWDITLLCTVLKNTCTLDPQELANVEKIRIIRNTTSGHKPGASLSNQAFYNCWSDLSSVIDDILKAMNDKAFYDDINAAVSFIRHDKDADLLEAIVKTWLKDEETFVETKACLDIQSRLKMASIVTIGGISGSGKSSIAHHVALRLSEQGYTIYPVNRADEIEKYANFNERQVFVLDDPVGKHEVDWNELKQFEKIHQNILSLTKGEIRFVLTCRKNILNDDQFKSYETVVGMETIDLSSEMYCLVEKEKKRMFEKYASQAKLSVADTHAILRATCQNFPLLCKVFGATLDKLEKQAVHFFSEPFSVMLEEVKTLRQRDKYKYCSLILCLTFQNTFDINCLNISSESFKTLKPKLLEIMYMCDLSREISTTRIERAFKALIGVYFIQEDTRFRFMHDVLFDVVAYHFGTDYPCEMLKACSSSFIREYVRTEDVPTHDEHVIRIRQKHYIELTKRLYSDLRNGDFHDVFLNPSLRDPCFIETFCSHTKTMKKDNLVMVYFKTCSNLEGYKSAGLTSKQRWNKDWFIKDLLDDINTRAIHWVMAYNHLKIFYACHSVAKTLKVEYHESNSKLKKFKSLFAKTTSQKRCEEHTIFMICLGGNIDIFRRVRKDNLNVEFTTVQNSNMQNALHMATISGNVEMVEMLIMNGVDAHSPDCRGMTPLFLAAAMGHSTTCMCLIQNGVNVHRGRMNGTPPLFIASQEGHTGTVNALLKQGARVNMCKQSGASPLFAAVGKGHMETMSVLLEQGADVSQANRKGISPLYKAIQNGQTEIVRLLLEHGTNVKLNKSILHLAAGQGNADVLALLLQHRVTGRTVLIEAAKYGCVEVVDALLASGADVNIQTTDTGITALIEAARYGCVEVVDALLAFGADVNIQTTNTGITALIEAARYGYVEVVDALLASGADVNIQITDTGRTALIEAAKYGYLDIVEALITAGANVHIKDKDSETSALTEASKFGHADVVKRLACIGTVVNTNNKSN